MAIRPLFMRLRCEKCLGLNRSFIKYKKLPQISESTLGANATQILALHFSFTTKNFDYETGNLISKYINTRE